MKEVIIIFAFLLTLATSIELVPILAGNNRVSAIMNKVKPIKEAQSEKVVLPKHNLNRGQLKKMEWLRYVDKV